MKSADFRSPPREGRREALQVRSFCTRVPGWPRGFSLPLEVFVDGGKQDGLPE